MATQIQLRRGTAAEWTSADPTLAAGELGIETDTERIKVGDGDTAWSALPYLATGDMTTAVYDPQAVADDAFARANHTGTQALSTISDAGDAAALDVGTAAGTVAAGDDSRIVGAQQASEKGQADGYASLDGGGTVPAAQLPAAALVDDLSDLSDVDTAGAVNRNVLAFDGTEWVAKLEADFKTVYNNTGSLIPEGTVVAITGSAGAVPLVTVADKDTDDVVSGVMVADIAAATTGVMQAQGTLQDSFINTLGMTAGDLLYLGDSGAYVGSPPGSGNIVIIGAVGVVASSNGSLILDCPGYVTVIPDSSVTAAKVDSEAATDGYVLTADGAGGAAWEAGGEGTEGPQGPPGLVWMGAWDTDVSYAVDDAVSHSGRAFIATQASTGVEPPTTATDNTHWDLLADRGEQGTAGSGVDTLVVPEDLNLIGWTWDPQIHAGATNTIISGEVGGVLMRLPAGTITHLHYRVWVAGAGLTGAEVGLVDALTGDRICVATDQVANMQSAGQRRVAIDAGSVEWGGGLVYACAFSYGQSTDPRLAVLSAGDTAMLNARSTTTDPTHLIRCGRIGAGSQTSIPASLSLSSNQIQNRPWFMAVE